jgi:hypothetical protein
MTNAENNQAIDDSNEYLNLEERDLNPERIEAEINKLSLKSAFPENLFTFTPDILHYFTSNEAVLGQWYKDINIARKNNSRFEPYSIMEKFHFASSTIGLPGKEGATVAKAICRNLNNIKNSNDSPESKLQQIEQLVSQIAIRAFESVCDYYNLDQQKSEILFDDNATMALYQFMSYLPLRTYDCCLTFFDTGRVIPAALQGTNPETHQDNFRPTIDIFGNKQRIKDLNKHEHINQFFVLNIEHYIHGKHKTDEEIKNDILHIVTKSKPEIILIPSVTRLGRLLPFNKICRSIKESTKETPNYNPWIILDDAQGVLRIPQNSYENTWQNYDAILQTGAKVTGALMGAGAIIFNKEKFYSEAIDFSESKLTYRSNRYNFISTDHQRIAKFNSYATGVCNAPEIASLIIELGKIEYTPEIDQHLQKFRQQICTILELFNRHIEILKPENGVNYIPSIIGFHFGKSAQMAAEFKSGLNREPDKIIIPALVSPLNSQDQIAAYSRIALDPKHCTDETTTALYSEKISYLTKRLKEILFEILRKNI